jgi:hypothetical protein
MDPGLAENFFTIFSPEEFFHANVSKKFRVKFSAEKNRDERQSLSGRFDEKVRTFSCQISVSKKIPGSRQEKISGLEK